MIIGLGIVSVGLWKTVYDLQIASVLVMIGYFFLHHLVNTLGKEDKDC